MTLNDILLVEEKAPLKYQEIPREFTHLTRMETIPWTKLLQSTEKSIQKGVVPFKAFTDSAISLAKKEKKKKYQNLDILTLGIEACIAIGLFEEGLEITEGINDFKISCLRSIAAFTISDTKTMKKLLKITESLAPEEPSIIDEIRLLSGRIMYGAAAQDEEVIGHIIEFDSLLNQNPSLLENPFTELLFTIYVIGVLFSEVCEYERALKTSSVLEKVGRSDDWKTALILSENLKGRITNRQGDFLAAETHYKRILEISKELGHQLGLGIALNNLGSLMLNSIRLEEALEYLQQANEMFESDAHRIRFLINLGEITTLLGQYDQSQEYMQQALALDKKTGIGIVEAYTWMVVLLTKTLDFHSAKVHLQTAKKLADASNNPKDKSAYFHAKGVLESAMDNIEDATQSFEESMKFSKPNRLLEWIIRALLDLIRTYLKAYQISEKNACLSNAAYHLDDLIQIAKEQKLHSLNAEALLLRSDLRARAGGVDEAKNDLERVAGLAAFLDNVRLEKIVAEKRAALSTEVAGTIDLGYSSIDKVLDRVAGFHPSRELQDVPQPTIHVLIAINKSSGLPEFVYHFDELLEMDSSMLSGFISAITSFAGEMMGSGVIRSINQEGFALLLEHSSKRIITLIASEETFDIRYRLHEFADQYEQTFPPSKEGVVTSEYSAATELVSDIFGTLTSHIS